MIKPTLVISVITATVSALLITAHNLTSTDTSGVLTDALREKCVYLMGEGEYSVRTDRQLPDGVYKVIEKDDGTTAFEIKASGYNKDGLDLLIALSPDGGVRGIAVVSIAETPGLGTNIENDEFLSAFTGASSPVTIVKKTPTEAGEVEAVSGATYSSKGVAKAVNTAIGAYKEWTGVAE